MTTHLELFVATGGGDEGAEGEPFVNKGVGKEGRAVAAANQVHFGLDASQGKMNPTGTVGHHGHVDDLPGLGIGVKRFGKSHLMV